jgi:anti-sigma regulatory factor (Ser/Thr protein kinase)
MGPVTTKAGLNAAQPGRQPRVRGTAASRGIGELKDVDANEQSHPHARDWAGRSGASFGSSATGIGVKQIMVQFDRGPAAASAARSALMPLDDRLEAGALDDIRLLVSELVTNSVRHATDDGDGTVGLEVNLESDCVRVEVTDEGSGFEPKPRTADQSQPGGWGLYLVDKLADRWGVNRNSFTHVWFEMDGTRVVPAHAI